MKKNKRYIVNYVVYDENCSIYAKKQKLLISTNYLWFAKFYFKYKLILFRGFCKNCEFEFNIYDSFLGRTIACCFYFNQKG